jgi:outer membrane immunogenic protein
MKRILLTGLGVGLLVAGQAFAADMPVKAPIMKAPPPPAFSWTGCYLGGGGGYGMYDAETTLIFANGVGNVPLDQGGKGWFGTAQGGCDYQLPTPIFNSTIVIGAFADGDWGNIHGDHTGQNGAVGLVSGDMKLRRSWAAGGRIGYVVNSSLLAYVSGWFTEAFFDQVNYANATGNLTGIAAPSQTYNGFFIGSGYEYGFSFLPGLFWKTEYRWAEYRTQNLADFRTTTGLPNGVLEQTHPFVQTLRSEIVWRFNWFH